MSSSSNNIICPRCGSEEFHKDEYHYYIDSEELSEDNKHTYTRRLTCLKCNFEFEPSSTYK
jgi:hypothetical protein